VTPAASPRPGAPGGPGAGPPACPRRQKARPRRAPARARATPTRRASTSARPRAGRAWRARYRESSSVSRAARRRTGRSPGKRDVRPDAAAPPRVPPPPARRCGPRAAPAARLPTARARAPGVRAALDRLARPVFLMEWALDPGTLIALGIDGGRVRVRTMDTPETVRAKAERAPVRLPGDCRPRASGRPSIPEAVPRTPRGRHLVPNRPWAGAGRPLCAWRQR